MLIVTLESIPGKEIEPLGIVKGSTIQTVNALRDIGAGFKTLIGGELTKYNEMMDKARQIATDRMVEEAERLGADALFSEAVEADGVGLAVMNRLGRAAAFHIVEAEQI